MPLLLPYHLVTLTPYHLSTLPPYHLTTLPPYHLTTLPPYHLTTLQPYHLTTLPPYHLTTLQPYHLTALPPYHLTTLPPYNLTTLQPYHLTTLQPYHVRETQTWLHQMQRLCNQETLPVSFSLGPNWQRRCSVHSQLSSLLHPSSLVPWDPAGDGACPCICHTPVLSRVLRRLHRKTAIRNEGEFDFGGSGGNQCRRNWCPAETWFPSSSWSSTFPPRTASTGPGI